MKKRILVIDDSEVMLLRIKQALLASGDGFEVVTTAQAVGNARHVATSDLIIVDFHMPAIDGATVMASLRDVATALDRRCLFYLYTSDPALAGAYARFGFDGAFSDKGDEAALVRQVRAVFRMLQMRALARGKQER